MKTLCVNSRSPQESSSGGFFLNLQRDGLNRHCSLILSLTHYDPVLLLLLDRNPAVEEEEEDKDKEGKNIGSYGMDFDGLTPTVLMMD
jgi:hypothetical protein